MSARLKEREREKGEEGEREHEASTRTKTRVQSYDFTIAMPTERVQNRKSVQCSVTLQISEGKKKLELPNEVSEQHSFSHLHLKMTLKLHFI